MANNIVSEFREFLDIMNRTDVPQGIIILHKFDDRDAKEVLPLNYDVLAHPRYVEEVIASVPRHSFEHHATAYPSPWDQLLREKYEGVDFYFVDNGDFMHAHDKRDGGAGSLMRLVKLAQTLGYPVYYRMDDKLKEVDVGAACSFLDTFVQQSAE